MSQVFAVGYADYTPGFHVLEVFSNLENAEARKQEHESLRHVEILEVLEVTLDQVETNLGSQDVFVLEVDPISGEVIRRAKMAQIGSKPSKDHLLFDSYPERILCESYISFEHAEELIQTCCQSHKTSEDRNA